MTTLREPFEVTHEKGGFTYVSWSQVADRLDEVGGMWTFEIVKLDAEWCHGRLTIDGRVYENVGYAENVDQSWKKEPLKDAVSDAFKRCAALAGVARYLYDKDAPPAQQNGHTAPTPIRQTPTPVRSSTAIPDDFMDLDFDTLPKTPPVLSGTVAVTDRVELSEGENWCPVHGLAWVLKPAGTSKTGAPYDAFYACASKDKPWCKEKPTKQWVEAHKAPVHA